MSLVRNGQTIAGSNEDYPRTCPQRPIGSANPPAMQWQFIGESKVIWKRLHEDCKYNAAGYPNSVDEIPEILTRNQWTEDESQCSNAQVRFKNSITGQNVQ